jgi:hypothetical protein
MAEMTTAESRASAPAPAAARPWLASRPQTFAEQVRNSSVVWLALMAYWALADILHAAFPSGGRQVSPDGWLTHLALTLAGLRAPRRGAGCCSRCWSGWPSACWRSR